VQILLKIVFFFKQPHLTSSMVLFNNGKGGTVVKAEKRNSMLKMPQTDSPIELK